MSVNLLSIKQKILDFLNERGPSLPINLTKITGMNLTFTSAILSELLAERKIKISNLKIGSSPLYYLEGQEEKLENFLDNIKSVEKDAFLRLKQNRILEDEKQEPAIRVALRSIKDFAIPMKVGEKLYWKYHLLSNEKAMQAIESEKKEIAIGEERVIGQNIWNDIKKDFSKEDIEEIIKKRVNEIVEKIKEEGLFKVHEEKKDVKKEKSALEEQKEKPKEVIKEIKFKKRKTEKKPNPFFENVKKILEEKNFVFVKILKESKENVHSIFSKEGKNFLFLSYNKKILNEKEVFKDFKKHFLDSEIEGFFVLFKGDKKEKFEERRNFYLKFKDIFSLT